MSPIGASLQQIARIMLNPCISSDRKSTRLNSSHVSISYAAFCLNKKMPAETATAVRFLPAVRAVLPGHAPARAQAYRVKVPGDLVASLPGLAEAGAPMETASIAV